MNKVAFITGVTGQDGAYLSEFLLKKGFLDNIVHRKNLKKTLTLLIQLITKNKVNTNEE